MTGKGQHIRQEVSSKTAEEYRATADEHAQTLKDFWKKFMASGLFVVAAIVIILACLAWFLNNSQVRAGGVNVSAAGARLALTTTEQGAQVGYYERKDAGSDTPSQAEAAGFDTTNSMTVTLNSNLNNESDGKLYPGARGQIKLTVTPLADDLNGATISISRALKSKNSDVINESSYSKSELPELLKLTKGHLLFFTGCDNGFYSNRVTDSITIDKSEFCEGESDKTTKPVNVTLYWVWPEYLQNFVYVGNANYYKNIFAEANTDYTSMQGYVNDNKSHFYYGYGDDPSKVPALSSEMKSTALVQCADYYNKADDCIGNNVDYLQLQLSADETPRGN